ncbi:hypothetical protein ACN47E_003199 [Coniothyrium glycines]
MAVNHGVMPKTMGMLGGYPMDPNRVGELLGCIETFQSVRELVERRIAEFADLTDKDVSAIFPDMAMLEDRTSQWYNFKTSRIIHRLSWFSTSLMSTVDSTLERLNLIMEDYLESWHRSTSTKLTELMKENIADTHGFGIALSTSLENTTSLGPYRLEMLDECKSHLQGLDEQMYKWQGFCPGFKTPEDELYPLKKKKKASAKKNWFEQDQPLYSLAFPSTKETMQTSDNAGVEADAVLQDLSSQRKSTLAQERCTLGMHDPPPPRLSFPTAAFFMIVASVSVAVVTAIIYCARTGDVQTAATIAGVIIAAGGLISVAIGYLRSPRDDDFGRLKIP